MCFASELIGGSSKEVRVQWEKEILKHQKRESIWLVQIGEQHD